jgi:hypothetical protein
VWGILAGIIACALLGAFASQLPIVQDTLGWRLSELRAEIKYALNPPEEGVFAPDPTLAAIVDATLTSSAPSQTPTQDPGTPADQTLSPTQAQTATPVPTALPEKVLLEGVLHEYQQWNNCGPATLSMGLSYWGWREGQGPVAKFTKPNPRDKNVMPYELADFVTSETDLAALVRVGGDQDLLKLLLAEGYPVIIEKGFEGPGFDGWMGHYQLLVGYDEINGHYNAFDTYEGDFSDGKTLPVPYQTVEEYWRHFNHTYLVIHPPEDEARVLELLGSNADETENYRIAAQKASDEIFSQTARNQMFAWFNRGTNLMRLQDYGGAANAYDEAFALYAMLDPSARPWRLMWYQTGPYWAYFYTGRYWDVINLATQTLDNMSEPVLEESYYWRGLSREALGDVTGAIEDFRASVDHHPEWEPGLAQLERLGIQP